MTEEEREQQLEKERQKQLRKEERKKAIKNLDTIISSLQELEDLPSVDQNGKRGTGDSGQDLRDGWQTVGSARNVSSYYESYSSGNSTPEGKLEIDEKDHRSSRGEKGDDSSAVASNPNNLNMSGGSGVSSNNRDAISGSSNTKEKGKQKEKEKSKKPVGLARLGLFHKRATKEKITLKPEQGKKADTKKKPQKKGGDTEHQREGEGENGFIKVPSLSLLFLIRLTGTFSGGT